MSGRNNSLELTAGDRLRNIWKFLAIVAVGLVVMS